MCAPSTVAESKIMATRGAHASVCAPAILGFLLLHSVALVNSREGEYTQLSPSFFFSCIACRPVS